MDADTGRRVTERRTRLGMSVKALAERAKVDRGVLARLEAGSDSTRPATIGAVEAALDRLEHEMGMDVSDEPVPTPEVEQITFLVEGDFGVKVTVKGPISNRSELEASVSNIIRSIRESSPTPE